MYTYENNEYNEIKKRLTIIFFVMSLLKKLKFYRNYFFYKQQKIKLINILNIVIFKNKFDDKETIKLLREIMNIPFKNKQLNYDNLTKFFQKDTLFNMDTFEIIYNFKNFYETNFIIFENCNMYYDS